MRKIFIIATVALLSVAAAAQSEVSRAISAMSGQQAQFTQKFTARGFTKAQVESGTVVFGPSPKMRWSYASPEQKTFVFDGTTSWFYVPSDRQVTINQLTEAERKALPFLLLADAKAVAANYSVKETAKGNAITTRLIAKDPAAMVREITVTTSAGDHRVSTLHYQDKQGNKTTFEFRNYKATSVGPALFAFDVPAGVQVVRQ